MDAIPLWMPYIYGCIGCLYKMDCTTIMDANYNHMHNQLDTQQMKCKDSQQYIDANKWMHNQLDANYNGCKDANKMDALYKTWS